MRFVAPERFAELKATGKLPSPKGVALSIIRLLQRDDYRVPDLVQLVQSDPAIAGRILAKLKPGGIVLLHDTLATFEDPAFQDRGPTMRALEILAAERPDWSFVTVSELLKAGSPVLRNYVREPKTEWLSGLTRSDT